MTITKVGLKKVQGPGANPAIFESSEGFRLEVKTDTPGTEEYTKIDKLEIDIKLLPSPSVT